VNRIGGTPEKAGVVRGPVGRDALQIEFTAREQAQEEAAVGKSEMSALSDLPNWVVHLLVLGAVWLASAVYVELHIGRGWVPADEGTLA